MRGRQVRPHPTPSRSLGQRLEPRGEPAAAGGRPPGTPPGLPHPGLPLRGTPTPWESHRAVGTSRRDSERELQGGGAPFRETARRGPGLGGWWAPHLGCLQSPAPGVGVGGVLFSGEAPRGGAPEFADLDTLAHASPCQAETWGPARPGNAVGPGGWGWARGPQPSLHRQCQGAGGTRGTLPENPQPCSPLLTHSGPRVCAGGGDGHTQLLALPSSPPPPAFPPLCLGLLPTATTPTSVLIFPQHTHPPKYIIPGAPLRVPVEGTTFPQGWAPGLPSRHSAPLPEAHLPAPKPCSPILGYRGQPGCPHLNTSTRPRRPAYVRVGAPRVHG